MLSLAGARRSAARAGASPSFHAASWMPEDIPDPKVAVVFLAASAMPARLRLTTRCRPDMINNAFPFPPLADCRLAGGVARCASHRTALTQSRRGAKGLTRGSSPPQCGSSWTRHAADRAGGAGPVQPPPTGRNAGYDRHRVFPGDSVHCHVRPPPTSPAGARTATGCSTRTSALHLT
jgi:hypothetical protein